MATYKEVKGVTIQTLDEDPVLGGVAGGTWSSGGTVNNARDLLGGAGPQTSALVFGGQPYPGSSAYTESYDGSSWTEVADLNTARILLGGLGTSNTAVIGFGGNLSPPNYRADTESWNGSAWTEVNDLNDGRWAMAGNAGTQTAGLLFGGAPGEVPSSDAHTESWNGTSWSNEPDMNTARSENAGAGTSTNALSIAGTPSYPTATAVVEQWNGSSWTEITDINTARNDLGGLKGGGTITDALVFGGINRNVPAIYASTEFWDGSSWTELADLGTARYGGSGSGTSSAALYAAGNTGSITGISEEWALAPPTASILTEGSIFLSGGQTLKGFGKGAGIPAATWASGGNLNTARNGGGSAGIQTAALCSSGGNPSDVDNTEQYDGTSWTEVSEVNTARSNTWTGLGLSYSAAILSSGRTGGSTRVNNNESWNGSNWTEVNEVNTARNQAASSGSQTSGIASGGHVPPYTAKTESWDGTSWTETTDLNTPRYVCNGAGQSSSSALNIGGYSSTYLAVVEQWDGSSWTEVGDLNTARYSGGASVAGPVDSVLYFGGDSTNPTPSETRTEFWNGTSWTELNDLSSPRWEIYGAGASGASALAYGGYGGSASNSTEEWTADNTLADISFD
jgi:hypothetical protein